MIFLTNHGVKSQPQKPVTMNFFFVIVVLLMIGSSIVGANHVYRGRRRTRRCTSTSYGYRTIMQDRNLAAIRSSDSLNILGSDHYGYYGLYNRDICGYMDTHVYINGTKRNLPVPTSVKEGFIREYFAKIYTPVNFPLTYRKEGVYIDGNSTNFDPILSKYYFNHCVEPNLNPLGGLCLLIFTLVLASIIIFSLFTVADIIYEFCIKIINKMIN